MNKFRFQFRRFNGVRPRLVRDKYFPPFPPFGFYSIKIITNVVVLLFPDVYPFISVDSSSVSFSSFYSSSVLLELRQSRALSICQAVWRVQSYHHHHRHLLFNRFVKLASANLSELIDSQFLRFLHLVILSPYSIPTRLPLCQASRRDKGF